MYTEPIITETKYGDFKCKFDLVSFGDWSAYANLMWPSSEGGMCLTLRLIKSEELIETMYESLIPSSDGTDIIAAMSRCII
jgi:hypothetical protein